MLKGIPSILSPRLLKILMEMGHGDEIVIGDGNFPAQSMGQRVVRLDGHGVPEILDAIMTLFPLDQFVEKPAALMSAPSSEPAPPIWSKYEDIIKAMTHFPALTWSNALLSMTAQIWLMPSSPQANPQFMQISS